GLHGFVRHLEADLVARGLGDGGLVGRREAAVGIGGGAVEEKLRAFQLDRHVSELPLQALKLAKRTAELLARRCILARPVESIASEGESARGIADALDVEPRHLLLEAAGPEQHVFGRHAAIVEVQLAPLLAAHEGRRLAYAEARRAALDD